MTPCRLRCKDKIDYLHGPHFRVMGMRGRWWWGRDWGQGGIPTGRGERIRAVTSEQRWWRCVRCGGWRCVRCGGWWCGAVSGAGRVLWWRGGGGGCMSRHRQYCNTHQASSWQKTTAVLALAKSWTLKLQIAMSYILIVHCYLCTVLWETS